MSKKKVLILVLILITFLLAGCTPWGKSSLEHKIIRVENGLRGGGTGSSGEDMELTERMAFYQVPGLSMVLINDYKIEWAKTYGVLETGTSQPVTTNTLFQTGSTAKPIVAAAALHLVEEDLLDLDTNVNNYLVSWKVPDNHLTAIAPVTLRRLLSHNAGLDYIPLLGYQSGEPLPTREQILNGQPPAVSAPVEVLALPGSLYSYSNGGYLVVEQLLVDVTGQPFAQVLDETILDPLDLSGITVSYPLPTSLASIAASGHLSDGSVLPGKWHTFPEMGPGGSWWATPTDLANFNIELMLAYSGRSETILSQEMALEMLTPQIEDRGLGPWIGDDGGNRFYFGHPGHNYGYKSYSVYYPERGQGLVIMTNSENGDALYREILNSVNDEYGWLSDFSGLVSAGVFLIILGTAALILRRRFRLNRSTN